MDRLIQKYGRSGSGRASVLRLMGTYIIFQTEGGAGFRKRGYSRDSIQLYRDKLYEAGVQITTRKQTMPEEQIALESPDGFEITTTGETVSGARIFVDGGNVKEADMLDPTAGASSSAPASSGIPSAMRQQGIHTGRDFSQVTEHTEETPMGDRTIPMHQDTKP
jgi:hypothetical protein